MKFFQPVILLFLIFISTSCSNEETTSNETTSSSDAVSSTTTSQGELKTTLGLEMSKVQGFIIAQGATSSSRLNKHRLASATSGSMALHAMLDNGSIQEVKIVEKDYGGVVQYAISTGKYSFFGYGSGVFHNSKTCFTVILNNDNGSLYCLPLGLQADWGQEESSSRNLKSMTNDVIFMYSGANFSDSAGLYKIDMSGDSPSYTLVYADNYPFTVKSFAVNADNDVFLGAGLGRIYKNTGGLQNITTNSTGCIAHGLGTDNTSFYYYNSSGFNVSKLIKSGTSFTSSTYDSDLSDLGSTTVCDELSTRIIYTRNKIFLNPNSSSSTMTSLIEYVNASGNLTAKTISGMDKVLFVFEASEDLFVIQGTDSAGNGMLSRYIVSTDTFETALAPGDYSFDKVSVSSSGEIIFAGTRNSDGAKILATVAAGGTTATILSSSFSSVKAISQIR